MSITVSLVVLLGIGVALALKLRSATAGAVILAALFGFYLAQTHAAPSVNHTVTSLTNALTHITT